jgi:outer membrane protein assembly factor BamB
VLGLIAFALVRVLGGDNDDASGTSDLPELPLTIDEQWSESVRGDPFEAEVGMSSVYVSSDSSDEFTLTSFSAADGMEEWEITIDGVDPYPAQLVGEYDDTVVFEWCGEQLCSVTGIEKSTGDIAWDRGGVDSFARAIDVSGRLLVLEGRSIERVDPEDGRRLERVRGDDYVEATGSTIVVRDGDEIEVFDSDLNPVFGPVEIDPDASAFSFTGSQVVVAVGDDLQFIDADGRVVVESNLDGEFVDELVFVAEDNIIIAQLNAVISFDPIDGDADERWSVEGERGEVLALEDDVLVLVRTGTDVDVIEADTGDRRFQIDDVSDALSATNGLLVDGDEREIRALDWEDGDEIWAEQFDGWVSFGAGVFVEVTADGDVTLFR